MICLRCGHRSQKNNIYCNVCGGEMADENNAAAFSQNMPQNNYQDQMQGNFGNMPQNNYQDQMQGNFGNMPQNNYPNQIQGNYADSNIGGENKKSNTLLIVIILVSVLVLLLGIIAAVLLLNPEILGRRDIDDSSKEQGLAPDDSADSADSAENTGTADVSDAAADWHTIYADYLQNIGSQDGDYYYGFVYFDDDDIPEIILQGNCEAAGNRILTCSSGVVEEYMTNRLYVEFLPRMNAAMNSDGNSGAYHDAVFHIENGKWVTSFDGTWSEYYEMYNEETEYIPRTYYIGSSEVSEIDYYSRRNREFDRTEACLVECDMNYQEMLDVLKNDGSIEVACNSVLYTDVEGIHRYEFVVEDCNFYTAMDNAKKRGGHLATIETAEEYDYIVDMINSDKHASAAKLLWVAGINDGAGDPYRWYRNDGEYSYVRGKLIVDDVLKNKWFSNDTTLEPTYFEYDENGDARFREDKLCIINTKQGLYLNDVNEDILLQAPYYKGKIAYIVEFE